MREGVRRGAEGGSGGGKLSGPARRRQGSRPVAIVVTTAKRSRSITLTWSSAGWLTAARGPSGDTATTLPAKGRSRLSVILRASDVDDVQAMGLDQEQAAHPA